MERTVERTITTMTLSVITLTVMVSLFNQILERMAPKLSKIGSGILEADGTEQPVFEHEEAEPFIISGYINLKNMEVGDTVTINQYVKLSEDEDYTLYLGETYTNSQTEPLKHVDKLPTIKGIKITLQQTSGTLKAYSWEFYKG